jgi:protein-disulfide isomerase
LSLKPAVSERDHVAGPSNARITLVEYGDFECPHCGAAFPILKRIERQFSADLRFVFRHFPLSETHPHALQAAEAAEAAGAQGKFWPMHELLFENQNELGRVHLLRYAKHLGLDLEAFERDLEAHTFLAHIRDDLESGIHSGVNGTPTLFINGIRYDDRVAFPALVAALEGAAVR